MTSATVTEPARQLPVAGAYDVVVAGGGVAGVAAAVAAARGGASVCLLDKMCGLGGLATLGNVIVWLPLCDGRGRQVVGGLGEELLQLAVADLGHDRQRARFRGVPDCWRPDGDPVERRRHRYRVDFNPAAYMLALEQLVLDAGVCLLYDTRVCAVRRQGDRVSHVLVENKSGRSAIACGVAVDATGDADLCFLAGEETESLDSNVLCGWYYHLDDEGLQLHPLSNGYSPHAMRNDATGPFFRGDDAEQVTAHVLGSRDLIRRHLAELRQRLPDDDPQPVMPPSLPCLRMTRRLVGAFSLGEAHVHEWFADAVGLTGDWRKAGPVYAVPLRSLCAVSTRNLITAGRCISVDTTAWDVTRAIPACVLTGEAAGTAAALAVAGTGSDLPSLPVTELQAQLRRQRGLLDPSLVAPAADGD